MHPRTMISARCSLPERKAQNWAAALAYPSQDRILMKSPRLLIGGQPHYEQVFLHEVAHVALDQAARGGSREAGTDRNVTQQAQSPATGIPRWLHEGYAIHVAREWSPNREVLLTRAVVGGRLIPLGRLVSDFPEDEEPGSTGLCPERRPRTLPDPLVRERSIPGFCHRPGKGVPIRVCVPDDPRGGLPRPGGKLAQTPEDKVHLDSPADQHGDPLVPGQPGLPGRLCPQEVHCTGQGARVVKGGNRSRQLAR